jgi:hypothetical protein
MIYTFIYNNNNNNPVFYSLINNSNAHLGYNIPCTFQRRSIYLSTHAHPPLTMPFSLFPLLYLKPTQSDHSPPHIKQHKTFCSQRQVENNSKYNMLLIQGTFIGLVEINKT